MSRAPYWRLLVAAAFVGAVVGCDASDDRNPPRNNTVVVDEPDRAVDCEKRPRLPACQPPE